ncbi:MAG: ExeM/NucH family extracellular endonuclease [Paludibacteraceae bacterium]
MKKIYFFVFLFVSTALSAQVKVSIPVIQGSGSASTYSGQTVTTSGIVTAKYIGSGMINGFFIQDAVGDGNPNTSDGIFVYSSNTGVMVGDLVQLNGKVGEYNGRTQLSEVTALTVLSHNNPLPVVSIVYDIHNWDWEKYEGMLVEFQQTLFVNNNYNLKRYGELELGTKRKPSPTNVALPGSAEYSALVSENALPPVYLDDAYSSGYIFPNPLADENGTRRMGERVDKLQAIVDYANSRYVVYPVQFPVHFYGNPRKMSPDAIGNYNLKVCGFNLEYYLTSPNSSSMGPSSQQELDRQHTKIVDALLAIDADIYGLVEIEQGQTALTKLSQALNSATGTNHYTFINDNGTVNGTYTKVAYLYRSDKVTPYLSLKNNNSTGPVNRKKLQGFTLKSNNERFIFSINHFKAKSGCSYASGADADQGDGQGCYNAERVAEANSVITSIHTNKAYYADEDALVMGDLNAYAGEDPVQTFVNAGYTDLHFQFHADSAYSYVYHGEAGYLDQALANETLLNQVTGVTVFHINADEPSMFEYSGSNYRPDMYRSSDHDPVVVGLKLGENVNVDTLSKKVKIYPSVVDEILHIDNAENAYVQIFAMSGIKIHQEKLTSGQLNVKDLGLIPGTYIVRVLGENKIVSQIMTVK